MPEIKPLSDSMLLAKAVDAASNSLLITDHRLPHHPIIFCNTAFERMTGYSRGEILGKNCRFLQGTDADQPGIREIRQALGAGTGCTVALRNYRKDGSVFWNELVLSPVHDDRGQISHYIGIQKNITEQMVGRNASLDRVNLVSHELKTPLTTIKSTLQLLQQRGVAVDEPFLQKSLAAALRAVARLEEAGKKLFN